MRRFGLSRSDAKVLCRLNRGGVRRQVGLLKHDVPHLFSLPRRAVVAGVLATFLGCAPNAVTRDGQVERSEGYVDISLPITEHRWSKDGSLTLTARGVVEAVLVGFAVDLAPEWRPQPLDGVPITLYRGKGQIRSLGPGSDAFLALLFREYALPSRTKMLPQVDIAMVSVGTDPAELRVTPAKIKIFFQNFGEAGYGEAFINLDLRSMMLEFRDKDPEYHQGILLSLGGGS